MEINVDTASGTVTLNISGTFTAEQLRELLSKLGQANTQFWQPTPSPEGKRVLTADRPRFWLERSARTGGQTAVFFDSNAFGWVGMTLDSAGLFRLHELLTVHVNAATEDELSEGGGGLLH